MSVNCVALAVLSALLLPAACNPVPAPPRPTAAEVRGLLGKSHLDDAFFALAERFGNDRTATYFKSTSPKWRELDTFYHTWRDSGFEVVFDADGKCDAVFVHNREVRGGARGERVERYGKYPGELPNGLTFGDNYAAVVKKLGPGRGDQFGDNDTPWMHSVRYPKLGVTIEFNRPLKQVNDPDCRIQTITVGTPDNDDD